MTSHFETAQGDFQEIEADYDQMRCRFIAQLDRASIDSCVAEQFVGRDGLNTCP
jgi:hypothetical protein